MSHDADDAQWTRATSEARDLAADNRDRAAEFGDDRAGARDAVADASRVTQPALSDFVDPLMAGGEQRDRAADERDLNADERDEHASAADPKGDGANAQQRAAGKEDRRSAREDRELSAADRQDLLDLIEMPTQRHAIAANERLGSMMDRIHAAEDRVEAANDRGAARADRS
jgi:hypothetical protein